MTCPTCGSSDPDVFLPLVLPVHEVQPRSRVMPPTQATLLCDNPWHENRIEVRKSTSKSGEAAARQTTTFWPSGFTVHYNA